MAEAEAPWCARRGRGREGAGSRLVRCICCGVTLVEIDVSRGRALLLAWQLLMLALFALWCEYDYALGAPMDLTYVVRNLALFALVGLGLHLAFASRYALTAVGFTLLLTALSLQWGVLANGYFAALAARASSAARGSASRSRRCSTRRSARSRRS